jgi:hypothetical protein
MSLTKQTLDEQGEFDKTDDHDEQQVRRETLRKALREARRQALDECEQIYDQ